MRSTKSVNPGNSEPQEGGAALSIVLVLAVLGLLITLLSQPGWVSDKILEKVVDADPQAEKAPRIEYQLGLYCFYLADGKHAREIFTRVLEEYPESEYAPMAVYRIAQTWDDEGNRATAILWFRRAVAELPEKHAFLEDAERKVRALSML